MNRQDIFDKVSTHLLTQMRRAQSPELGRCEYQLPNGDQCAIGYLIPASHEGRQFIGDVSRLLQRYPDLKSEWGISDYEDIHLLTRLQRIHDRYPANVWRYRLRKFANSYNLKFNPPVKVS